MQQSTFSRVDLSSWPILAMYFYEQWRHEVCETRLSSTAGLWDVCCAVHDHRRSSQCEID